MRLRRAVAAIVLRKEDRPDPVRLSMSFGLAELRDKETWEELVNRADQARHKAKRSGRNAVFVS
ncbi:MAG: diguanylate cyclase [Candidatus Edwardsbacteria bacterium]|nr:diguanylate cyclase [Candidatus Edwardsbacteria bacterium]